MPAWALRTRARTVSLASQQEGPWVPLRWLLRVLIEWRVIVLQSQEICRFSKKECSLIDRSITTGKYLYKIKMEGGDE